MGRWRTWGSVASLLVCLPGLSGCKQVNAWLQGDEQKPFPLLIRVESDPGKALGNIPILYQGKEVKRTSADGAALLELHKPDGANVELTITCPPDTRPAEPLKVFVRRVEGQKQTEQRMYCRPLMRRVGIAIRADDGPFLPVTYLGQTVATTDASGAAHFAMTMPPGEVIKVALDASANPKMRPQRAESLFKVGDADDIFVLDAKFTTEKKPTPRARPRPTPKQL